MSVEGLERLTGRLRESFRQQTLMRTFAATLDVHTEGSVTVTVPSAQGLLQQHGFIHAGVVAAALDTACGYAAISVQGEGAEVLTAEYKVNFLAPARGSEVVAYSSVVKVGRTLLVCRGEARCDGTVVAIITATMVPVDPTGRPSK